MTTLPPRLRPTTTRPAKGVIARRSPDGPLRLTFDGDRVGCDDAPHFARLMRRSAEASVGHPGGELADTFLHPLRDWCADRHERVRACYVVPHARRLNVCVLARDDRYDYALGMAAATLSRELFQAGWRNLILQVPADAAPFVAGADAMLVYESEGPPPPQEG